MYSCYLFFVLFFAVSCLVFCRVLWNCPVLFVFLFCFVLFFLLCLTFYDFEKLSPFTREVSFILSAVSGGF